MEFTLPVAGFLSLTNVGSPVVVLVASSNVKMTTEIPAVTRHIFNQHKQRHYTTLGFVFGFPLPTTAQSKHII